MTRFGVKRYGYWQIHSLSDARGKRTARSAAADGWAEASYIKGHDARQASFNLTWLQGSGVDLMERLVEVGVTPES